MSTEEKLRQVKAELAIARRALRSAPMAIVYHPLAPRDTIIKGLVKTNAKLGRWYDGPRTEALKR